MKKHAIVPKNFKVDTSIKTLEIHGKEWFDRVNGNSYNSVQVFVNEGMKNAFSFSIPFQYGYGNYFEQSAIEHLVKVGVLSGKFSHRDRVHSGKLKIESYKTEKCLQREVKAHGTALQTI